MSSILLMLPVHAAAAAGAYECVPVPAGRKPGNGKEKVTLPREVTLLRAVLSTGRWWCSSARVARANARGVAVTPRYARRSEISLSSSARTGDEIRLARRPAAARETQGESRQRARSKMAARAEPSSSFLLEERRSEKR